MKFLRSLLLVSAVFFIGCNTCSQCHLTSSPSFNSRQSLTLLILPVTANGNPGLSQLPNFSDDISTPFLESGFRLIDRSAAKAEALKLGLDFDKGIDEKNIPALASALHVDAVLISSAAYTFVPAESGVIPASFNKVADSTGKVREVSSRGPEEYNRGEHYILTSLSSRLINARDMTTMLTAYVEPCGGLAVNTRLVNMLREKLAGKG